MEIETRIGVLVSFTNPKISTILGVGMNISAVYALMGVWVENDEALDEALESLLYKTPRPNKDEKWVDAFTHETVIGTFDFRRISVIEEEDSD